MSKMPKLNENFAYFVNVSVPSEFGDKKLNADISDGRIWIFRENFGATGRWVVDTLEAIASKSYKPLAGSCLFPSTVSWGHPQPRDYFINNLGLFIHVTQEIFEKIAKDAEVVDGYLWPTAQAVVQSLIDQDVILGRNDPDGYIYKYVKGFTKEEIERVRLLQEEAKKKHEETLKHHQEQLDALRNLILVKVPTEEADKIVDKIKYFDYYHSYSDDIDVSHRGMESEKELRKLLDKFGLSWDIVQKYHTGK